ncbi:MAG: POTRA domain-containing protein, partial [Duganella sp.]
MTFIHHARRSAADTPVRQPGLQRLPLLSTVAALLLAGVDAHAQTGVPNAGTILQQVQPALPAPPSAPAPSLRVQAVNPGASAATLSFAVKTVRITGNTVFSADVLHALVADGEGRTLTLAQVEALAARITAHYQASGYPLSRAVVPAQTVADGTVTIEVLEARYGKVGLNNSSRVDDAVLGATVAALQSGQAIDGSQLDRTLLLLSDIPGVGVNAVLKPGAEVGTSAIEIDATNTAFVLGSVLLDNYGNHYTGRARAGGSLDVLNPFHHGDTFSVSAVSSGDRMKYGRVAYDILLDGAGTRVGTSYSSVHYRLGRDIAALDAHGAADVASAWIKRPLIRDKQLNVYAQLQYDAKRLRDRVGVTDTRTDRQLDNWILTLNGDRRDDVLGGGISVWSLAWTRGHNSFDDAAAEAADALSARTRGSFSKWNA